MESNKHSEEDYLKELAPTLFEKKVGYNPEPPERYFDGLEAKLRSKIEADKPEKKAKVFTLINFRNVAIAAAVAAIFALIPFFNTVPNPSDESPTTEYSLLSMEVDAEDVEDYLSMDLLYESLDEDSDLELDWRDNLSEEEIYSYLMEEDISEDIITETILN